MSVVSIDRVNFLFKIKPQRIKELRYLLGYEYNLNMKTQNYELNRMVQKIETPISISSQIS